MKTTNTARQHAVVDAALQTNKRMKTDKQPEKIDGIDDLSQKTNATTVEFVVKHRSFYVPLNTLLMFPDSYFCAALKPHWNNNNNNESSAIKKLELRDRDPELFQYVVDYLRYGCVPRNKIGECLLDRSLLAQLRDEADYYCLSGMVDEINALLSTSDTPACNSGRVFASILGPQKCNIGESLCDLDVNFSEIKEEEDEETIQFFEELQKLQNILQSEKTCTYYNSSKEVVYVDSTELSPIKSFIDYYNALVVDVTEANLTHTLKFNTGEGHKYNLTKIEFKSKSNTKVVNNSAVSVAADYHLVDKALKILKSTSNKSELSLIVNDEEVKLSHNESTLVFVGQNDVKFNPITSGMLIVLYFDILVKSQYPVCQHPTVVHQYLADYLVLQNCIGVFTNNNYFESGFTPHTLQGKDKELYEFATANNIPVSLVYVMVEGHNRDDEGEYCDFESQVSLLDPDNDTRLDYHKDIEFNFVQLGRQLNKLMVYEYYVDGVLQWKYGSTVFLLGSQPAVDN